MPVNYNKNHPIFKWCAKGDLEKVKGFIDVNPPFVNARDENSITPLMYAVVNGHLECAKLLVDAGAKTEYKNSEGAGLAIIATRSITTRLNFSAQESEESASLETYVNKKFKKNF